MKRTSRQLFWSGISALGLAATACSVCLQQHSCAQPVELGPQNRSRKPTEQLGPRQAGIVAGHFVWMGQHCQGRPTALAIERMDAARRQDVQVFELATQEGARLLDSFAAVAGAMPVCTLFAARYGPNGAMPMLWQPD